MKVTENRLLALSYFRRMKQLGTRMLRSRISRQFAELIFPKQCPFCNVQIVAAQTLKNPDGPNPLDAWCEKCWQLLVGNPLDRCQKCGATTRANNPYKDRCKLCHGFDLRFGKCIAIGNYYGKMQRLVVDAKRQHNEVVANQLGRLLGRQLDRFDQVLETDLVVPVPTHWWRKFSRGFHASSVIAGGVGATTGIPLSRRILYCNRQTRKQGTLSTAGRIANVRNSFGIRSPLAFAGKRILLVDDVMTSGATVSEAARILLLAGAESVDVAVVARGAKVS